MRIPALRPSGSSLVILASAALLAACADNGPVVPNGASHIRPNRAVAPAQTIEQARAIATIQRVTARYQELQVALDEGFVLLHECENRPGEGPVGTVYVHLGRLMDGVIDPSSPDALIYEPGRTGRLKLVGAEFAIPYVLWTEQTAPAFLGNSFQREDEFGVYALHAWVWRANPEGMFAETNPKVSCGAQEE